MPALSAARSPPGRSAGKEVPEDEDGQLQEAIRRSLAEKAAGGSSGGSSDGGSRSRSRSLSPAAVPSLAAAAAAQLLQRQRQQQRQLGRQRETLQQEPAAAVMVDLTAGDADADEAAAEGPDAGGSSGSDAEMPWEDAAAEVVAAAEEQLPLHPELLSSVNRESAQRLEEWLGGGSSGDTAAEGQQSAAAAAAAAAVAAAAQEAAAAVAVAGAAAAAVGVADAGEGEGEGMAWEDADDLPAESPASPGPEAAAALAEEEPAPVAQEAGSRQRPAASAAAAGMLAQAAAARQTARPAPADRHVRFSSAVQVRVLPQQQAEEPLEAAPPVATAAPRVQTAEAETAPSPQPAVAAPPITHRHPSSQQAAPAAAAAATPPSQQPLFRQQQPAAAAPEASPQAAAALGGPASALGGYSAAELAELAALDGDEDAWEDVLSPPQPQRQQQQQQGQQEGQQEGQQQGQQEWGQPQEGDWPLGEAGEPLDVDAALDSLQAEERRLRASQRAGRGQVDTPTSDMYQDCMELLTVGGAGVVLGWLLPCAAGVGDSTAWGPRFCCCWIRGGRLRRLEPCPCHLPSIPPTCPRTCPARPQMFGLPYIIAPQEAEAQCAWLDSAGLVDGVVTDDNDVFLFGAQRVYRCGAVRRGAVRRGAVMLWWRGDGGCRGCRCTARLQVSEC